MIQLIRMNLLKIMKKPKRKPEPYEEMLRAENLDAYESLIKFNLVNKKNNKSIEQYEFIFDEKL